MKFCAFLVCFAAALGGCSSKVSDPDPYATVPEFCEAWGKAACTSSTVAACSGADPTPAATAACVAKQETFCEGLVPVPGYSSVQAKLCLDAVQAAYADGKLTASEVATVRHRGAPCDQLIKGPKAAGDSCMTGDDCDTVDKYQCLMKAGQGTCGIPMVVANGTSCEDPGATCNSGFYCDGKNCVGATKLGKECAASYECDTGLVCNGDADAGKNGVCTMPVDPKQCTEDDECTSGVCAIPFGGTAGQCVSQIILTTTSAICEALQ